MGFSTRLKELRDAKDLSQEELADALGIPRSSIAHYENDDSRTPRRARLEQIADFFGVTVDDLLGRKTEKPDVIARGDDGTFYAMEVKTKRLYDVIARASELPEDDLDEVADALDAIIAAKKNKRKRQ